MYPVSPHIQAALGRSAAELLVNSPEWVRRRKEKVMLLDESTVRRQLSVDFALPTGQLTYYWQGRPVVYAPLFFLQKGADEPFDPDAELTAPERHYANFDFRDETGRALSLPARSWNADITAQMLGAAIEMALEAHGEGDPSLRPGMRALADALCQNERLQAEELLDLLRQGSSIDNQGRQTAHEALLRELDATDATISQLLDVCTISSVVMVPLVGREPHAGIFKLSYDEQVKYFRPNQRARTPLALVGWAGYELWVEACYVASASYHFELQAPEGLELYDAGLLAVPSNGSTGSTARARVSGFASRVHLYEPDAVRQTRVMSWVRLRVRRQEFVSGAAVAGSLIALVLWGAWALQDEAARSPASVPTLLLLFPSVIAAYVVRPTPHRLTVRMLRVARYLVGITALLPVVAAGFLALAPRDDRQVIENPHFGSWWLGLAILATGFAVILIGARIFPIPELTTQRLRKEAGTIALQLVPRGASWLDGWRAIQRSPGRFARALALSCPRLFRRDR